MGFYELTNALKYGAEIWLSKLSDIIICWKFQKWQKSFIENACPLGTTPTNSHPALRAQAMMQKRQSGGKFFTQIPGVRGGGVVMAKIDSCIIKVIV